MDNSNHVKNALKILKEDFVFVGSLNHYDKSVSDFHKKFGRRKRPLNCENENMRPGLSKTHAYTLTNYTEWITSFFEKNMNEQIEPDISIYNHYFNFQVSYPI